MPYISTIGNINISFSCSCRVNPASLVPNIFFTLGSNPLHHILFRVDSHPFFPSYFGCFPKNRGTPKSSIFMEFSLINHPFWGSPIYGTTHFQGFTRVVSSPLEPRQGPDGLDAARRLLMNTEYIARAYVMDINITGSFM